MKGLIWISLAVVFLGCGDESNLSESDDLTCSDLTKIVITPEKVKEGLDRICRVYEAEQEDQAPCDLDGFAQIQRLSNVTQRLECVRYYVDKLLSLHIGHLSYWRQWNAVDYVTRHVDESRGYFSQLPGGWEERYDVELRLLEWQKEQIERVKPKRRVKAPYSYDSWMSEKEFQGWCIIYYGGMDSYESRLRNLEGLLPLNRRRIPENEWERIVDKVENYLGRPIRTKEQLRRDFKEKKRMVYTQKRDDCDRP